jgi:hypothetical protein
LPVLPACLSVSRRAASSYSCSCTSFRQRMLRIGGYLLLIYRDK